MMTDYFRAAETGDTFGTRVPAADDALRVDGDDGVVDHALHQDTEALLALAQVILIFAAFGQVARDLREAEQLAGGIADDRQHHVRPEARAVLAHAPAFFLETSFQCRGVQLPLGKDLALLAGWIERR